MDPSREDGITGRAQTRAPRCTTGERPRGLVAAIRVGVGENLFPRSDKKWARLQPLVAPAFRKRALEARLSEMDAIIKADVQAIPIGETIDLEAAMGRIALSLAAWVM